MNKPIRRVAVFCMVLVFALLLRANWVQAVVADSYADNSNNERVRFDQFAYPRGSIIVGGENGQAITGSDFVNGYRYKYKPTFANGPMYAPVTGYFSQADYGSTALENLENGILSGTDDRLFFGNAMDTLTGKKKQGGNVVTTINPAVQQAAFQAMGNKKGAAIALDPRTGAILAMVSTPSFDPNSVADTSTADGKNFSALSNDPDQPMLNRALRQTYPPGSTFKLVTAATAFETGKYQTPDDQTDTPDHYILPGTNTELKNDSPDENCGGATLKYALQISCNTVYGKLGADLGETKLLAQAQKFGFNNTVDTPIRSVASNFPSDSSPDGTAMDAIGQHNTAATPLQMAMVAAAIANNGKLMQPYLVDEERSPGGTVISKHTEKEMDQAVSPATAQKLQQMMVAVVQNGTGVKAQIPGVEVGGKTGTAQHGVNNSGLPFAWFVSYAKVGNDYPVAVAVVVEDGAAQSEEIAGGSQAAPIAKAMMQAAIGH
ncbi:peptidoglycan D,D-transpeptidase FtsI family protein [Kitasatospora viridis]|uniref:Cell division protein FtsI/penicillin-binding protein 2 n=1 Tax=Kitasatospora viridis TaxID=281105 RepID=A0A561UHF0_9ACTN|nr:penicillin-binding protein 2 [Kitasatospora viridis]TWF98782.1 cell division protein FtsI/penicillin-binding protein 2 [Kitasatospora viridis]